MGKHLKQAVHLFQCLSGKVDKTKTNFYVSVPASTPSSRSAPALQHCEAILNSYKITKRCGGVIHWTGVLDWHIFGFYTCCRFLLGNALHHTEVKPFFNILTHNIYYNTMDNYYQLRVPHQILLCRSVPVNLKYLQAVHKTWPFYYHVVPSAHKFTDLNLTYFINNSWL